MNQWSLNNWKLHKKTKDTFTSYETRQKFKYIKGSVFAIVLGLILAGIIIAVQNVNPFIYLRELFKVSFSGLFVEQTFQWLAVYIIAGLAVGIGFKSGMFNIGVSGQMLLGAGLSIIYYKLGVVGANHTMNAGHLIVIFLICLFSGAFLAGIAGLLKALFNIHEVVTTIMLNWTVWYLLKFIFTKYQKLTGDGINTSASMPADQLAINGSSIAIPLIIALVCLVVVALLLAKTVFGYKLKAVGSSPNAAKYAGFNVKAKLTQAMLISGGLAGIASFINVLTLNPNIAFTIDNLPSTGYDAIAISLVAFNNPIGIFFTSFLWGVLQSGGASTASLFNMPSQTASLVFGIIVYFAAISVVFMNYYPILRLRICLATANSRTTRDEVHDLHLQQWNLAKQRFNWRKLPDIQNYKEAMKAEKQILKTTYQTQAEKLTYRQYREQIRLINHQIHDYVHDYKNNLKELDKKLSQQVKTVKKDNYIERLTMAKQGIKRRESVLLKITDQNALGALGIIKSDYVNQKDQLKTKVKEHHHWKATRKALQKEIYQEKIYGINAWYEGEKGDLTHYFLWFNTTIETKGEIEKQKIKTKNKIDSLRSDYRLNKNTIFRDKSLNREQRQEALQELKTTTKAKINHLNEQTRDFQAEQLALRAAAKADYQKTIASVRVQQKLTKIKKDYRNQLRENYLAYQAELALINQKAKTRKQNFDKTTAKAQLIAMKGLVKVYQQLKLVIKKQRSYPVVYLKRLETGMNKLLVDLEKVNHKHYFTPQDNHHFMHQKARLYKAVMKEEKWIQESMVAFNNLDDIREIKVDTKRIMTTYEKSLAIFSQDYKAEKKEIIKNKVLNHQTKGLMLNESEKTYSEKLQAFILELEAKTRSRIALESEKK